MSNKKLTNIKKICFLSLSLVLCLPVVTRAQTSEYTIKAAFLERFTRFVEWPEESAVSDTTESFVLGVIGENPFGSILEQLYATQKVKNKEVEIQSLSNLDEISGCHLLFISKSKEKELSKILSLTKDKPILTISDANGFAENGVLINLYLAENKIRFEINETAVR
ncbi:MAG: YfiR family protein, partial [Calditrichia bacterium]